MGSVKKWWLFFFVLMEVFLSSEVNGQSPAIVISEYFNAPSSPSEEWIELLVIQDNFSLVDYQLRDNNSTQMAWQPPVTFKNVALWQHLRAGTVIVVWTRTPLLFTSDKDKADGYLEIAADDATIFSYPGGSPTINSASLVIAKDADLIQILDASSNHIHALGHNKSNPTGSWASTPNPRLNYKVSGGLSSNMTISVSPGSSLDEYGTLLPQSDSIYTTRSYGTFGLPNVRASAPNSNSNFWRSLREPEWVTPTLTVTPNSNYTQFSLSWNSCQDVYPADNTTGYLILRSSDGLFSDPVDGQSYSAGSLIGSTLVLTVINGSSSLVYTDNSTLDCGNSFSYKVVAFRYIDDQKGVVNLARGRAYNQSTCATAVIQREMPNTSLIWIED